jgi:divalent metal cation (Fe/Co/Zn/Cd) transporter
VLVPGTWTVHRGHELAERIESDIRNALRNAQVLTHLEALDGPGSSESTEQKGVSASSTDPRGKARDQNKP